MADPGAGTPQAPTGPYTYTPVPNPAQNTPDWAVAESKYSGSAGQTPGEYQSGLNQDVASGSNLMSAAGDQTDPTNAALSARATQIYSGNVNRVLQGSAPQSINAISSLQTKDISNQAALYSNSQTIQTLNFKQAQFQQQAAISYENAQRSLESQLFGSIAQIGGLGLGSLLNPGRPGQSPQPPNDPTDPTQNGENSPSDPNQIFASTDGTNSSGGPDTLANSSPAFNPSDPSTWGVGSYSGGGSSSSGGGSSSGSGGGY